MVVVLLILIVLFLMSMSVFRDNSNYALSVEQTQSIKGFFVVTIFFSHFCSYVVFEKWYDVFLLQYCHWLGQLMVLPFLFYSGYGIFESVKKKGISYIKEFPKKRILKILLHFDLAVLLFLLYDVFFMPENLSVIKVLLSLIAWDSIGNSNWFIFAIICVYLFGYVSLLIFKGDLFKSLILIGLLCFLYVVVVSRFKPGYWFDTVLSFPLGCFVSLYKDKINVRNHLAWGFFFALSLIVLIGMKKGIISNFYINSQLAMASMVVLILLISMRVRVKSKILSWFGGQVFGIYILQRLSMNFGKYMHWNETNIYLYFVFCFFATLLLAYAFNKVLAKFDSYFFQS